MKKEVKELPDSARKVDKTQKLSAIKKETVSVLIIINPIAYCMF